MVCVLRLNEKNKGVRALCASVILAGVCLSGMTWAQTSKPSNDFERRAAAEALFDEARSLMTAQRFTEACAKFEASQALDPAVGTRLNLADCLEKLGRTASAWAEFRATAAAARAKGQTDRAEVARKRAASLEKDLVRLSIIAPPGANEGLEIRKNGSILERASWGTALPVDPGRYVIAALIGGKETFLAEVDVPNKSGTIVTTVIPPIDEATLTKYRIYRGLAITTGAISITSFVVGGILGVRALVRNAESAKHCVPGNICDDTGVALRRDALNFGNASTAALLIGAGFGVGSIVFHVTTPPHNPPTRIGIGAMHSGVGLVVGGAF
jgi:hypothetical protein